MDSACQEFYYSVIGSVDLFFNKVLNDSMRIFPNFCLGDIYVGAYTFLLVFEEHGI